MLRFGTNPNDKEPFLDKQQGARRFSFVIFLQLLLLRGTVEHFDLPCYFLPEWEIKKYFFSNAVSMNIFGFTGKSNPEIIFTRRFFKKLKKNVKGLELVRLKELEINTKYKDKVFGHFLNNAYAEYVREEENKNEVIERYVHSAATLYKPEPEFAPAQIVPVIKDRRYVEGLREIQQNKEAAYVFERYNEDLFIFYARDSEHSIRYLMKDDIQEYNIETEGLQKRAIENLMNVLPKIESHGENGYYMLTAGGAYEASLILVKSIWTKENFTVVGEMVIGIPARDLVLITGSEDREGLNRLKSTVMEVNQTGDHLVSDQLFIYQKGKFQIFNE